MTTERKETHWRFAGRLVRPEASRLLLLFLMTSGSTALLLLNPQIIRSFLDTAKSGGNVDTLLPLSFAFIGVVCVQQLISTLQNYTGDVVGWNTTNSLRSSLFRHCLRLDLSFHHQNSAGYLMERIENGIARLVRISYAPARCSSRRGDREDMSCLLSNNVEMKSLWAAHDA